MQRRHSCRRNFHPLPSVHYPVIPAHRWLSLFLIACAGAAQTIQSVLPSGGSHPTSLAPGMLMSIYGSGLGPETACTGQADTARRETPSPQRPLQTFAETLIYPTRLCGVEVRVGGLPAGLLYVHSRQINFKAPQQTPLQGAAAVQVFRDGRPGPSVTLKLGLEFAVVTLDGPAFTRMPVWIRVWMPHGWQQNLQYPFGVAPGDFACHSVEVRRNGALLPRLPPGPPRLSGLGGGGLCGFLGLPGPAASRDRLPLHLQYRFDQPGDYEVRYILNPDQPAVLSEWTPIHVGDATPEARRAWLQRASAGAPRDAADIVTSFLPSVLGIPDDESLEIVSGYLHHPEDLVRRFAAAGLHYWPGDQVRKAMLALLHRRGPSDVLVDALNPAPESPEAADLVATAIPFLSSDSPALLRGALTLLSRLAFYPGRPLPAPLQARAENALLDAAPHVERTAGPQTLTDYAAALGRIRRPRARVLLWDFVNRRIAFSQAVIALTWNRDPADLPRLAALLTTPAGDARPRHDLAVLPYALHQAYGAAALPSLEDALRHSPHVWVRTACARELVLAGRAPGFAFMAGALEKNLPYKLELLQFLRDRFPELRGADEAAALRFARSRAGEARPGLLF
ncbi:MAG: hypothetical protein IT158_03940 [Bryobacterales bacterium]|nr:hypothetical protein [Bryobacterales bacterium]